MSIDNQWRVRSRKHDFQWDGPLYGYWEVEGDPMSDDFTPDEIDADELLGRWVERYGQGHEGGLIPIHWFVAGEGRKPEYAPFAYDHLQGRYPVEDFLTFFEWPTHVTTGEPINWLTIPVADKQWNSRRGDKGGFIQEATGWKPSMLQPFVYLSALLNARG